MRLLGGFAILVILASTGAAYSPAPVPDPNYGDLHKAAETCDRKLARAALREEPVDNFDREGHTPLGYAAEYGCLEVAKILVAAGANVNASEEISGWRPIHWAAKGRHADVVRFLIKKGADVNAVTRNGRTAWGEALAGPLYTKGPEGDRDRTLAVLKKAGGEK